MKEKKDAEMLKEQDTVSKGNDGVNEDKLVYYIIYIFLIFDF